MSKAITLYEHARVKLSDVRLGHLTPSYLDSFDAYLKKTYTDLPIVIGRTDLGAKSQVGTVFFRNKQFEILPKLLGGENEGSRNRIYRNLLAMLAITKNINLTTSEFQRIASSASNLLEIYIQIFADFLEQEIILRPNRGYVATEGNLHCLKGKLKFTDQLKHNLVHKERCYCEYDEYSENNELNKLFRYVVRTLTNVTRVQSSFAKLKIIESYLSAVDFDIFDPLRASRVTTGRLNKGYAVPLSLAQMFVQRMNPEPRTGKSESLGILFDMNKVFEEFIFRLLEQYRHLHDYSVSSQKKSSLAIGYQDLTDDEFVERRSFGTRCDIVVRLRNGSIIVIDTKYKMLDLNDRSTYGITNADVYQVLAYASILSKPRVRVLPVLLFPHPTDTSSPAVARIFKASGDGEKRFLVMTVSMFTDLSSRDEKVRIVDSIVSTSERFLPGL